MHLERDGHVVSLVIDRAGRRNALTQEMWGALPDLVAPVGSDPTVRLFAVRSATPGVFSAGADVVEYRENAGDVAWGLASQRRVQRALAAIRSIRAASLAVVDGPCIGGAVGIALACDFRIATRRSTFGCPPAKLGMVFPVDDTVHLVRLVGPSAAKRLLFTGATIGADRAAEIRLVDELCDTDALDSVVARWIDELTATAPGSVRSMKRIIEMVQDGLTASTPETDAMVEAALRGSEHREGVSAFLERRSAVFP
jgi:enoyl-CoA hydratase/carnithine racemase